MCSNSSVKLYSVELDACFGHIFIYGSACFQFFILWLFALILEMRHLQRLD